MTARMDLECYWIDDDTGEVHRREAGQFEDRSCFASQALLDHAHTLTAENAALRNALGYTLDYLLSEKSDCEDGRIDISREPLRYAIDKARAALAQGKGRE